MQNGNWEYRNRELEQIPTRQLDVMLQEELQKADGDPVEVKAILAVLKAREADTPVELSDTERLAWKKYQSRTNGKAGKPAAKRTWVLRVACVAAILCALLVTVSYEAEAETFWERLVRWTDSVIEFFSLENADGGHKEYVFETEHAGLQQVYDAVTKLEITEPVVPMWLPDGYTLSSCKEINTKKKTTLSAYFEHGEKVANYNVAIYSENALSQYQKDESGVKVIEIEGVIYYIVRNTNAWVSIWTIDNIECSISVDCQEDEFYKIIRSIHTKEAVS